MSEWVQTKEITYGAATIKIFRLNLTKEERERAERKVREGLMAAMSGAPKARTT